MIFSDSETTHKKWTAMKSKAPFSSTYIYFLIALIGYATADLTILSYRDKMIPTQGPPPNQKKFRASGDYHLLSYFDIITQKNIFNSDRQIPPALGAEENKAPADAPPVLSNLALALIGTLVHADPSRSIATINLKSKNENQSFAIDDEIEGMAKIVKVDRNKVILRNLSSQRLEFIEIKQDSKLNFGVSNAKVVGEVTHESDTDMTIKRTDVDKLTSDLPTILQQARAVPHFKGGGIDGFTIVDLQKGSIFDRLGIKAGDVVKAANGEPIDSASKALELYNSLKTAGSIRIEVERDGKSENLNYTIR
jgi:general secretion pathway protein C